MPALSSGLERSPEQIDERDSLEIGAFTVRYTVRRQGSSSTSRLTTLGFDFRGVKTRRTQRTRCAAPRILRISSRRFSNGQPASCQGVPELFSAADGNVNYGRPMSRRARMLIANRSRQPPQGASGAGGAGVGCWRRNSSSFRFAENERIRPMRPAIQPAGPPIA